MDRERRPDQVVSAISLPTSLLRLAKAAAAAMGMTLSGFLRYCLAKELQQTEDEARLLGRHRGELNVVAKNAYPPHQPPDAVVSEAISSNASAAFATDGPKPDPKPAPGPGVADPNATASALLHEAAGKKKKSMRPPTQHPK